MQDTDKEKLRAFEQKMHDEGADGFADGPAPWDTWDESGAQAGRSKRVWEGKARRIYKTTQLQRSLGDRILSGLAMTSLTVMVVGIAGVYLTEEQPQSVAWTAVQPTPVPLEKANRQQLPARVQRPAPVIAEIEPSPPVTTGSATKALDRPVTETATSATPSLAEIDTEPAGNTAPFVETAAATTPAEDSAWGPAINGSDIEIITAPAALLLSSTVASSPDGSNNAFENDVSEMEMDPELAMEIATAPAVGSYMDAEPVTVTSMMTQESGTDTTPTSTGSDSTMPGAKQPARDMINRGNTSLAATGSAIPETDATTAGFATAAELNTAAESTTADTDPAQLAASLSETTTAHETGSEIMAAKDLEALDNLPPTAAGPAATVAEIPADSDLQAQDISVATGKDSPASETTVVALAEPEPAAIAPSPAAAAAAAPTGGWVVNLASYTYESTARKKLAAFQAKGVTGEIERITVNDKPLYRIRVTGFESSRSARASIPALQETLGLKGAWIARR
jgi:hypothetical protein